LKNQKIKKKNHVVKHRRNSQYFKEKKLQSKVFNQLNVKKSKIDKDNFDKKKRESWKKKKVILERKKGKFEKKRRKKMKK
jgi:hypothetical protein